MTGDRAADLRRLLEAGPHGAVPPDLAAAAAARGTRIRRRRRLLRRLAWALVALATLALAVWASHTEPWLPPPAPKAPPLQGW
ncbi:hypothetical protein [Streptomyces sp. NPDC012888]|uniref:hypothetical protein n=1 Tax=Streptomyces sp. NPDC012888 TaxID=3364855 RepID=UPI0036B170D6